VFITAVPIINSSAWKSKGSKGGEGKGLGRHLNAADLPADFESSKSCNHSDAFCGTTISRFFLAPKASPGFPCMNADLKNTFRKQKQFKDFFWRNFVSEFFWRTKNFPFQILSWPIR
jgi:hypothetical protein